jgi:hypothetical protein
VQQHARRGIRDLPDHDFHTIAGFAQLVHPPEAGKPSDVITFRCDKWRFEIGRRLDKLLARRQLAAGA